MKSIYEKFVDFKNRHGLSNEKITQIATEYANSNLELARSHFSEKYNISEYTFYKARDYAIIFCLVDDKIFNMIRDKSSTNYKSNNDKNTAASSLSHFEELLAQRNEFLNGFSNDEIIIIAHKYVEGISVKNIAIEYDTGEFAIKKLLEKGIINLILNSSIVNQISAIVGKSLNKILQKREANKKLLLTCTQNKITFLRSQIKCYNLYFRNTQTKPDLESLKNELQNAIKMYNETLRL